jgi:atypical dual specificity phosphatase
MADLTWLVPGCVGGCAYPLHEVDLADLAQQGVSVLVNLHERAHAPERLARYRLREVHLPVADLTPPTAAQLHEGIDAIERARRAGQQVAVHCGAGLGRTGTLLACYLVHQGLSPREAIARVRAARPGSIETPEQEGAVHAYAGLLWRGPSQPSV